MTYEEYVTLLLNFWWQVIDEFDQNVHFVEIDIEEDPEIAEAAGIMGTPCVQFLKNKEMLRLVIYCPFICPTACVFLDFYFCFALSDSLILAFRIYVSLSKPSYLIGPTKYLKFNGSPVSFFFFVGL